MYRFLTLTKAMFLIHIRDKSLLFWNFAFPVLLMVINGAAFGSGSVAQTKGGGGLAGSGCE